MANVNKDAEEYWISDPNNRRKLEDEYLLGDIIGKGMFSTVYKCLRKGRTEWTCKTLDKKQIDKNFLKDQIPKLTQLRHPNILEIREVFETATTLQFIIEYANGGEIFERIVSKGHFSEKDAAIAVRDILKGLQYLHSRGVIHGNLKPENLLYETEMDDSKLKLTDFGLGQVFIDRKKYVTNLSGTLHYSAPEFHLGNEIDFSADLWSLGFVMYVMLSGYEPFWNENCQESVRKNIVEGNYNFSSPLWDDISESAKELICKLLNVNPKRRPTAEETLEHPWTRGVTSPSIPRNKMIIGLKEYKARHRFKVASKAVLATRRAFHLLNIHRLPGDSEGNGECSESLSHDDDQFEVCIEDRESLLEQCSKFSKWCPIESSSRHKRSCDQESQSLTTSAFKTGLPMDAKDHDTVKWNPSSELVRKKLEAELRATEELARIKQNVIEKRLALELASLNNAGEDVSEEPSIAPVERKRLCGKPQYYYKDDEVILDEAGCKNCVDERGIKLRRVPEAKKELEKLGEAEILATHKESGKSALRRRETTVREQLEHSRAKTNRYMIVLRQLFQCMPPCFAQRRSYQTVESNEEELAVITHAPSDIAAGHVKRPSARERIRNLTFRRLPEIVDGLTSRKWRFR